MFITQTTNSVSTDNELKGKFGFSKKIINYVEFYGDFKTLNFIVINGNSLVLVVCIMSTNGLYQ